LAQVSEIDIFNPCKKHATVEKGGCPEHGFTKYLMQDPVFKNLGLYWKTGSVSETEFIDLVGLFNEMYDASTETYAGVCYKDVHYRGIGKLEDNCTADEERQMGICYPKCKVTQEGAGPVCIDSCPSDHPVTAGVLCCESQDNCKAMITDLGVKIGYDVIRMVIDRDDQSKLAQDIKKLLTDASGLQIPICSKN